MENLDVSGFYDIQQLGSMMRHFFQGKVTLRQAVHHFAVSGAAVARSDALSGVSEDDYCRVMVFLVVLVAETLVSEFGGKGQPLAALRMAGADPLNRMPDLTGCVAGDAAMGRGYWMDLWRTFRATSHLKDASIRDFVSSIIVTFTILNTERSVLEPDASAVGAVIKKAVADSQGGSAEKDIKTLVFVLDQISGPDGLPAGTQEQAQAGSVGLSLLKKVLIGTASAAAVGGAAYAASSYMGQAPGSAVAVGGAVSTDSSYMGPETASAVAVLDDYNMCPAPRWRAPLALPISGFNE